MVQSIDTVTLLHGGRIHLHILQHYDIASTVLLLFGTEQDVQIGAQR